MRQVDVYNLGRSGPIVWRLAKDNDFLPPTFYLGISRVILTVGDKSIDSMENPRAIDWSNGNLEIRLENAEGIEPGWNKTGLVVFTHSEPNGIERWTDLPWIHVVD